MKTLRCFCLQGPLELEDVLDIVLQEGPSKFNWFGNKCAIKSPFGNDPH